MSPNRDEHRRTVEELGTLRASLPVSDEALAQRLGYDTDYLHQVLAIEDVDPAQVWRLRDFMVDIARAKGRPVPRFSKLTNAMRPMAHMWFGSWDVPSTDGLSGSLGVLAGPRTRIGYADTDRLFTCG